MRFGTLLITMIFQISSAATKYFFYIPRSVTVEEGSRAYFFCSTPETNDISWTIRNAEPWAGTTTQQQRLPDKSISTLTINKVTMKDNGSLVRCMLYDAKQNFIGHATARLKVARKGSLHPESPRIVSKNTKFEAPEGREAMLWCTFAGAAEITVRWVKDGMMIDRVMNDNLVVQPSHLDAVSGQTTGRLRILRTSPDDAGSYTCVASNRYATVASAPIPVSIGGEDFDPSFVPKTEPVHFVDVPPNQIQTDRGQPVVLDCEAKGVPQPTVYWRERYSKPGETLTKPKFGKATYVAEAQRPAIFICVAESEGQKPIEFTVVLVIQG